MKKRTKLVAGIGSLALIACVTVVVLYVLRDPVNQSACAKIQEGMTEAEVTEILGRPCDDARPYLEIHKVSSDGTAWRDVLHHRTYKIWRGPAGNIHLAFEGKGLVRNVWYEENENSLMLRLRRMLRFEEEKLAFPFYILPPSSPYPLKSELIDYEFDEPQAAPTNEAREKEPLTK